MISERDLLDIAARNPNIRVTMNGSTKSIGELFGDAKKKRSPKYHNTKVYIYPNGGVSFGEPHANEKYIDVYDSIKEYNRGLELAILQRTGAITGLERQVPLTLQSGINREGKKIRAIIYRADYMYTRKNKGTGKTETVVEDVKPKDKKTGKYRLTKDFTLKWKILQSMHPEWVFEIF